MSWGTTTEPDAVAFLLYFYVDDDEFNIFSVPLSNSKALVK